MSPKHILAMSTLLLMPSAVLAHGNVDISNGSLIDVYVANEEHHGHDDSEKSYGIEAVWMDESGYFVYAEGETGAHDFYQLGAGKYFKPAENIGLFAYGAYAQGGYENSNEVRARLGIDYQVTHDFSLNGRIGYDYGNSKISTSSHDHDHDHDHSLHSEHSDARSQLGRIDAGFSYELGHSAVFSYNYVVQKQLESALVSDNDTNLHYEARLTYTESKLQPYVEYRQTNKAFDEHHFEDSVVQFGVSFSY
ncbi:hypothetical protein AB4259_14060 [Vibrio amylolyticus]|uniref:hypothetical protein n=1 Tax=Vibrio TaxID=662 RepID=UPI000C867514|nr:hypothetical protein [Vibrio sp. 10N.261.55.A7]PMJ99808.1 hypothetical protein BCU12_20645 [Vibrio sp. 10N.261.55.A7]